MRPYAVLEPRFGRIGAPFGIAAFERNLRDR
jgi:hypothetical protein